MDDIVVLFANLENEEYFVISSTKDASRNKKKLVDTVFGLALARNIDVTREEIEDSVDYSWKSFGEVYRSIDNFEGTPNY